MKIKSLIPTAMLENLVPYDKSKDTTVVDTKGDYKIYARGIDDSGSVKKYDNLEDVVRFLKPRDSGPEYRRNGGLQDEYTQYAFEGFDWSDILDGPPADHNTKYKIHLRDLPLKLNWVHKKMDYSDKWDPKSTPDSGPYTDMWSGYEGGDSGYDYTGQIYRIKYDGGYQVQGGGPNGLYAKYNTVKTLEDAKKQAVELTLAYRKLLKDKYGGR